MSNKDEEEIIVKWVNEKLKLNIFKLIFLCDVAIYYDPTASERRRKIRGDNSC
jgi:hypothetical protein